jgi:hypothetical protein
MTTSAASFSRDANRVPITTDGLTLATVKSMTGSNATTAIPLFHITGSVEIRGLWGVITTDLGSAHTAAYWRLNDQTAQVAITLATGTTLSSKKAGSTIVKKGLAATALALVDNAAGAISEPTTLETTFFSPFVAQKKTAAVTDIEYVYTTSQTPTTGAIQFFIRFIPLSADGNITVI